MNPKLAVALLQNHQQKVAQSVARQMLRTIPRYEQMGEDVLYRSINQLVKSLTEYLDTGDSQPLKKLCADMIGLRRLGGFSSAELLMAGMCFFPVLRRFFIRKAERSRIGLELYDEVEKKLFPVFVSLATQMEHQSRTDGDDDGFSSLTVSGLSDLEIEEVSQEKPGVGESSFDPAIS